VVRKDQALDAEGGPIGHEDATEALSILREIIEWSLAPARWSEVARVVTALAAAVSADDGAALRDQVAMLELLGPVRVAIQPGSLEAPASVPDSLLLEIREAIGLVTEFGFPAGVTKVFVPVTIFMSDDDGHEDVEAAVERLLESAGLYIASREDPVHGSWFRSLLAGARSPAARQALAVAAHAAESRLVLEQDAIVTATLMQNVGPLITALQPTKDAVVRLGAVLVVKVDWVLVVYQLTPVQQLRLDNSPELLSAPRQILNDLGLSAAELGPAIPGDPDGSRI
jgi:hypothetical protein